MKKLWPWLLGVSIFLLLLVIFVISLRFIPLARSPMAWSDSPDTIWREGLWHHHGRGMHWPFRSLPFMGILGMLIFLLLPTGLVTLIVLGIVFFIRKNRSSEINREASNLPQCRNCGKQVHQDWTVCPYCGQALGGE